MIIRDATIDDIPEIRELLEHGWQETYGDILSAQTIEKILSVWHNPQLFKIQIQDPSIIFVVAQDNEGKLLGVSTAVDVDEETCMLTRQYVRPGYQEMGIGTALMNAAAVHFPKAKKLQLEILEQNANARAYYMSNGFIEIDKKDETIGNDVVSTITMEKSIR